MFIVVTGLDGSGTSTIARQLHKLDKGSELYKTPSPEFSDRNKIDNIVHFESPTAHMLYYLSSTVYMSDYVKNHCDIKNNNIYVVRYLIDTVVSNRVAGIDINLDYTIFGHDILKPDLTLFVYVDESIRKSRIESRGKSTLDLVLDDYSKREQFLLEYKRLLTDNTLYIDNSCNDLENIIKSTYKNIQRIRK